MDSKLKIAGEHVVIHRLLTNVAVYNIYISLKNGADIYIVEFKRASVSSVRCQIIILSIYKPI